MQTGKRKRTRTRTRTARTTLQLLVKTTEPPTLVTKKAWGLEAAATAEVFRSQEERAEQQRWSGAWRDASISWVLSNKPKQAKRQGEGGDAASPPRHVRQIGKMRILVGSVGSALIIILVIACTRDRAVEAPVMDLVVGTSDASAPIAAKTSDTPLEESAPSSSANASQMIGRWEGVGVQDDGQSWEIVVNLTSLRGPCATVDYPTVPCQAKWICTSESKDGVITAVEKLQGNSTQNCIDNGTMTWRLGSRDVLDWTWTGQGQTARAQLHRAR
jgi:hypothetical protein